MFFVIDKSKIISYVLAICTVVILFVAAAGINKTGSNNAVATSTNAVCGNGLANTISAKETNSITNETMNVVNGTEN